MGSWEVRDLKGLAELVKREIGHAQRRSAGATNRADTALLSAEEAAAAAAQAAADAAAANEAALEAVGIADGKGTVYAQTTAPDPVDLAGLWIDTDDGNKPYKGQLVDGVPTWVLVQDAGIQGAVDAAAAAQQKANDALAAAAAAQGTADQAVEDAAAAQGTANDAKTAAGAAQTAADQAKTAASGAQTTANGAVSSAAAAKTAADNAQSAADAASTAAGTAQSTANQAKTDAALAAAKALEVAAGVLKNGGAEFDFDSWEVGNKGTIAVQTSRRRTGAKAWQVTTSGEIVQGFFPVVQGDTWRFRWWYQATGSGTVNGGLRLQAYNANAATPVWADVASSAAVLTSTWTKQEVSYTIPAGTTHIRARLAFANPAGITVYFDDVELVNVTDAKAAADAAAAASSAASAAQTTANQAKTDAANAQTAANTAQSAATAAQTTADQAKTAASQASSAASTAQSAADAAQSTANTAVTNAGAAQTKADSAASAAADAANIAGSKADVLIQSATPAAAYQKATTLWIDTTNSGNTPKRWLNSAWTVVSDKVATDAAAAAASATTLAGSKADLLIQSATPAASYQKATTLWIDTTNSANTPKRWSGTAWVATTDKAATDAAAAATAASTLAGSKADVLIQSTTPAAGMQKATTLWIDTTNGANTPKRWTGSTWAVVTDKAATDAAAAAVAAQTAANNAQTTANQAVSDAAAAQSTANIAKQTADAAQTAATNAQSSADGKNTVRYRSAAPTTSAADKGSADGDLWWVIPNVQTGIVTGQYVWMAANQAWVQQTLNSALLASVDAGKITTGTLVGITITGVTITGATITGGTVQTSATGKRVVLGNNQVTFYGIDGTTAVKAGQIEGVPNGASGGMIQIGNGNEPYLYIGNQSLPTTGSANVRGVGTAWFDELFLSGQMTAGYARLTSTGDASLASGNHAFQVGPDQGTNLIIDNNEIMVRNNGASSGLYLNTDGGTVGLGNNDSTINLPGILNATYLPSRIRVGSATHNNSIAAGAFGSDVRITFPSGYFTSTPIVFAVCSNSRVTAAATSPSTGGFTIGLGNWSNGTANGPLTIYYIAIQFSG